MSLLLLILFISLISSDDDKVAVDLGAGVDNHRVAALQPPPGRAPDDIGVGEPPRPADDVPGIISPAPVEGKY